MQFARALTTAFAVIVAASTSLAAQDAQAVAASTDQSTPVTAVVDQPATNVAPAAAASLAPTMANLSVGVHAAPSAPIAYEPEHEHMRHSVAMMIVGGAVLIVGAVVGGTPGTIIMIGGGTIGILGLIRYLQ